MLQWTTASEQNNDYFSVEVSHDAASFSESAQIKGNGTTESLEQYSYEYNSLAAGVYYFRLRQVDYDGGFTFSDVLSLTVENDRDFLMVTTHVQDFAQVDITSPRPVYVLNMAGSIIAEYLLQAGRNTIDVSALAEGMYILSDGTRAKRFIK